MICLPKLVRQAAASEHGRMLEEVIRNGRPLPLRVRLRLEDPETLPAAALGLALQRVMELTYRPTDTSIALLDGLLECARPDGSFGSISATAVALAALHAALDQLDALPVAFRRMREEDPRDPLVRARSAAASALHFLTQAQCRSDPSDPNETLSDGLIGDELDSTITLWQLGFDARFAGAIRYESLLVAVEDRGLRHDRGARALLDGFDRTGREPATPGVRRRDDRRSAA